MVIKLYMERFLKLQQQRLGCKCGERSEDSATRRDVHRIEVQKVRDEGCRAWSAPYWRGSRGVKQPSMKQVQVIRLVSTLVSTLVHNNLCPRRTSCDYRDRGLR